MGRSKATSCRGPQYSINATVYLYYIFNPNGENGGWEERGDEVHMDRTEPHRTAQNRSAQQTQYQSSIFFSTPQTYIARLASQANA